MLYILHTSCRQNIMGEKGGHSDFGGFDIQIMVKSNAIIIFIFFQIFGVDLDLPANQHSQSGPL